MASLVVLSDGRGKDEAEGESDETEAREWDRHDSMRYGEAVLSKMVALDQKGHLAPPLDEEPVPEETEADDVDEILRTKSDDAECKGGFVPSEEATPYLRNRPSPRSKPTKVELRLMFDKWKVHAEPSGERLSITGKIMMVWVDKRIHNLNLCRIRGVVPQHIWRPRLYNLQFKSRLTEDGVTIHHYDRAELQAVFVFKLVEDTDDHAIDSTRLRTFPFDGFRYNFSDCLSDEISLHTSKEIDAAFHIQGEDHLESGSKARRERKNTVMWYTSATSGEHRLKTISYTTGTHQSPVNNWVYVDLAFSLHVERDITYYVNKVFTPLVVIFAYGLLAYTFPPFELEARLMLLATMYLTVFAIQWTCHDRLPRTPHATVVDEVVWNIVMALLAIAVGSCVSFRIALDDGDTEDEYDIGWTSSRSSRCDLGFMILSILTMFLRGIYVWHVTKQYCTMNGSNIRFKNGVGMTEMVQPTQGRAFRYDLETREHTPVLDVNEF